MADTHSHERQTAYADAHAHADGVGPAKPQGRYLLTLSVAALGVVYGDIGTSPLYAVPTKNVVVVGTIAVGVRT